MNEILEILKPYLGENIAQNAVSLFAIMGALRVVFKLVSGKLQTMMTALVNRVRETEDTSDDHLVDRIVHSTWYRVVAFLVDYFASVKLPMKLK